MMALLAAGIAVLLSLTLALTRALIGPSLFDRVLAVNMVGTKTVLLIAWMATLSGRGDYLDIALLYALINFLGVIAVLRYYEDTGFGGQESN